MTEHQDSSPSSHVAKSAGKGGMRATKGMLSKIPLKVKLYILGGAVVIMLVFLVVLIISSMITALLSGAKDAEQPTLSQISQQVEAYRPFVEASAKNHGIPDFVNILLAIMMQESGGAGTDPMQSSESEYNLLFPRVPNGIQSPIYSVDVGVQYFAECLRVAGCTDPSDTDRLFLALQGYNFGKGYITWAVKKYGSYTLENAQEFSDLKKQQLGWSIYGDPHYVSHVRRYISIGSSGSNPDGFIYPLEKIRITSPYGFRASGFHGGIDFGTPVGTPVFAVADGTVVIAQHWTGGTSGSGSWGTYLKIEHSKTLYTLYAHNSSLAVKVGDIVKQGDLIAYSGNTGRSTGPHLHLEVYDGGAATSFRKDPALYLP